MNEKILHTSEQELVSSVSCETLMDYTKNISQWIRISSLQAELDSLDYVASVMKSFGYHVELLKYNGFISYPMSACVEVLGRQPETLRALGHCFTDSTPDQGLSAPVTNDSEACGGCIVLIDGLPNYNKIMHAKENGAVAVICVQDNYLHNMPVNPIWGSPTKDTEHYLPGLPVVSITHPDAERLRGCMKNGEQWVTLHSKVEMGWKTGLPILICDLPAPKSDKFVLLSCHIDSWEYGAMDNGTANATAMECARLLAQKRDMLTRGIKVAFWSGHSQGKFCGSSWYADTHFEELEKNCVAHVNIDSTGGKGAVVIEEPPVMPHTRDLAAAVIEEQTGVKFIGKRIGHFADQSFFGVGLSSVFGTFSEQDRKGAAGSLSFKHGATVKASGLGWWWHTEHDTIDKIDPLFLQRDTRVYVGVLWRLMTDAVLPFNFIDSIEDMEAETKKLQAELGERFDLSALRLRIGEVRGLVCKLRARCAGIADAESPEAVRVNEAIQKLAQCFVRMQFTSGNVYAYDLGTPMTDIPSLGDGYALAKAELGTDEYYMLETSLRRGVNRVMHGLADAEKLIEEYLN